MDGHYTREQNTWDHLLVVQSLASLREELPPDRVALLNAFLLRQLPRVCGQGASSAARETFAASRAIFAPIAPRLVLDLTDGAVHPGIPRPHNGDLDLFLDPARGMGTPGSISPPTGSGSWHRLNRRGTRSWFWAASVASWTSIEVDKGVLVPRGTVRVSGSPALAILPAEVMVRLRARRRRRVPARLEPADGAAALTVSTLKARVPLGRLTDG